MAGAALVDDVAPPEDQGEGEAEHGEQQHPWAARISCMYMRPPITRVSAEMLPTIGHGLGSTRWYGWCTS